MTPDRHTALWCSPDPCPDSSTPTFLPGHGSMLECQSCRVQIPPSTSLRPSEQTLVRFLLKTQVFSRAFKTVYELVNTPHGFYFACVFPHPALLLISHSVVTVSALGISISYITLLVLCVSSSSRLCHH